MIRSLQKFLAGVFGFLTSFVITFMIAAFVLVDVGRVNRFIRSLVPREYRGEFDARSTDMVVDALVFYAAGISAQAGIEILSRGFYALSDTRTPVTIAVISMALNIAFAALLMFANPFLGQVAH